MLKKNLCLICFSCLSNTTFKNLVTLPIKVLQRIKYKFIKYKIPPKIYLFLNQVKENFRCQIKEIKSCLTQYLYSISSVVINNILSLQVLLRVEESNCVLTQGQFLSRVRGQGEPEYSHRGNEYTGYNQVEEVVQGPPPDLYDEGDVKVGFRTTFVDNFVSLSRHSWSNMTGENQFNSGTRHSSKQYKSIVVHPMFKNVEKETGAYTGICSMGLTFLSFQGGSAPIGA